MMCKGGGKSKGDSFEREVQSFWKRVDIKGETQCWPWLNRKNPHGYAPVNFEGIRTRAHRVAWYLDRVKKPGKWIIRHRCDNPACCNPNHLFRGTQKQNMQEASRRGRLRGKHGPVPNIQGGKNGQAKLTTCGVLWARQNKGKINYTVMCRKLGVTLGTLSHAINKKTWKHLP